MGESGMEHARHPGLKSLHASSELPDGRPVLAAELVRYESDRPDLVHLQHPVFHRYLKMHKVALGPSGMQELVSIADDLSLEKLPRFLDAAGSAYAEAGLHNTSLSARERIALVLQAERQWQKAGIQWAYVSDHNIPEHMVDADEPFRYALNIAFAPLVKSIIVGNVTNRTMIEVMEDVTLIGERASEKLTDVIVAKKTEEIGDYVGLLHELNALTAQLYMQDPRYIPLPASARADTGYYHRSQTHDISIINHHWGDIRKVIPVEVKSKASLRDRQRYHALILRGKMHLTPNNVFDPRVTNAAYRRVLVGGASLKDHVIVEQLSTTVRELLRLYQQGTQPETIALRSLTKFYDTKEVARYYPELSKESRSA